MSKGTHLAEFELLVMLAIARRTDDAYGVTIRQEIEARTDRAVSMGAVYATLGRLGDKGLVTFAFTEPEPVPGGRSRKLCTLTRAGRQALMQSTRAMSQMTMGLTWLQLPGAQR